MDFEEIYRNYYRDIYLYMLGLSKNTQISEEIAQETFAKALKAIDSYDGSKDIRAWLFVIAKNTYFTYYRKQKRYICEEAISEYEYAYTKDFTEEIMDNDTAFKIHEILHLMKDPYKEVFHLRTFGELSFEQIGILFHMSSSWARVTYFRAKKMILEYMEDQIHE